MERRKDRLGKAEVSVYAAVWTGAIIYAGYEVYLSTDRLFRNYDDPYNDFSPGWSFLGRKRDTSDEEWKMWIPFVFKLAPWVLIQVLIAQRLKKSSRDKTTLCLWYTSIAFTFLWYHFGLLATLCTLLLPCISCFIISLRNKTISWLVHSITLALIYYAKVSDLIFRKWLSLEDEQFFMLTTAICWIQLRSISYSIDSIETYKHVDFKGFFRDLLQNVAYCLYLPTLFLGPVILYEQFLDGINRPYTAWKKERILKTLCNIARYLFWMYLTEFLLHYLYFNSLRFHPEAVKRLGSWAFYGMGYCMGQYFLNKYVVIYGITTTVCKAEDIDAPPQPKCIGRIHLYSDMWKHFDRGLYKFLVRYIYGPCRPKSVISKFFASALCFLFIYIWHGMHFYIFIWSFLNFVGLFIEIISKSIGAYFYKNVLHNKLNSRNRQRLECALASPLLALSAISNFYFFADEDIGHLYVWRTLNESWGSLLSLFFVLYCCCQTSTKIKEYEEGRSRLKPDVKEE